MLKKTLLPALTGLLCASVCVLGGCENKTGKTDTPENASMSKEPEEMAANGTKVDEHSIGAFTIPSYVIPDRDNDLTSPKNTDLAFPGHNDGRINSMADFIGANHIWPGYTLTEPDCLNDGGARMLELGSATIKTYLVNYYQANYSFGTDWGPEITSAVELAQTKHYRELFAKDLKTFALGVYIFDNSYGHPAVYWNKQFPEEARQKEYRELYELTYYLCKTYAGTKKTFIIQNWEGDWASRGDNYTDPDAYVTPEAAARMIDWANTRQDAVMAARKDAGCKDVYVYHALEVNLIKIGIEGKPCVTSGVIPYTYCDFYAYSAYDTQDTEKGFAEALDYLAEHVASNRTGGKSQCYIGEFGWPFSLDNNRESTRLKIAENVLKVAREKDFAHVYWWELYDTAGEHKGSSDPADYPGYWLVTVEGRYTAVWNLLYRAINKADWPG